MADFDVRALGEDDWETFRDVRLEALTENPEAFAATLDEEHAFAEEQWRERMSRSRRLLASDPAAGSVGVASVATGRGESGQMADLFGLWVHPDHRGSGVATALVKAAARDARDNGMRHLTYWVGTENGRAVAFASGFGFRPTDERRPMRVVGADDSEEEIAMVLPLGDDRA